DPRELIKLNGARPMKSQSTITTQNEHPQGSSAVDTAPDDVYRNSPLVNFVYKDSQDKMRSALREARQRFGEKYPLVIGGEKVWNEADADIREAIDFCRFYAEQMRRLGRPKLTQRVPGEESYHHYWARGVAFVIAPWNFPIAILCGMASAGVVTGNTVIMKPSEQSIVCAAMLMQVFEEAGVR